MASTFLFPVAGGNRPGAAATSIDPTARRRRQADIEPHGYSRRPATLCTFAAAACTLLATPSFALDLNLPAMVSPRRTGQMASPMGCWNLAIDSALEKTHRCACDRRNDHHHYNSEHEAGQARTHRQHLPRSSANQQV